MPFSQQHMDRAFALAREALEAKEVPVGCVFVDSESGQELAVGRNRTNETGNVKIFDDRNPTKRVHFEGHQTRGNRGH